MLWLSYGLAIVGAIFGVLVGLQAVSVNGTGYNTNFSTTMVTTRNATLDDLSLGSSLGGETVSENVFKTELVFGVLDQDNTRESVESIPHVSFGLLQEIKKL